MSQMTPDRAEYALRALISDARLAHCRLLSRGAECDCALCLIDVAELDTVRGAMRAAQQATDRAYYLAANEGTFERPVFIGDAIEALGKALREARAERDDFQRRLNDAQDDRSRWHARMMTAEAEVARLRAENERVSLEDKRRLMGFIAESANRCTSTHQGEKCPWLLLGYLIGDVPEEPESAALKATGGQP